MMIRYARWLFGSAAVLNAVAGLSLVFLRPVIFPLIGLAPATGTNIVIANIAGTMIVIFGYVYFRVAQNPVRYRSFIHVGAIGKLLAAVCATVPWFEGAVPFSIPRLLAVDLVYALLFLDYLRRTRPA